MTVWGKSDQSLKDAKPLIEGALQIQDTKPAPRTLILKEIAS
jgi:hypothetical protein